MRLDIKILNSYGHELSHQEMDKIVCKLWNIDVDKDKWATPPNKEYVNNWHELLRLACMSINRTGEIKATELMEELTRYSTLFELKEFDKMLQEDRYELKLLLFWIEKDYRFMLERTF